MDPASPLMRLARRARLLFAPTRAEREMDDEMRMHLELEIDERIRNGLAPAEARRTALVDFGGVERFKDEGRTARGVRAIEDLVQDGRYAVRMLRISPAFSAATVLTVAIGIAAMTAVFSVVNAVLLRPPQVADARRLFMVAEVWKGGDRSFSTSMGQYMYPYSHYVDLRHADSAVFDGLAGFRYSSVSVRTGTEPRALSAMIVSGNYFRVLGLRPALGQLLSDPTEVTGGVQPEVVISYDLWRDEYQSDSGVIGRSLTVDGQTRTVVGVAPREFNGTEIGLMTDLWVPTNDGAVALIGRLRPGISADRAAIALTAIGQHVPPVAHSNPIVRMTLDPVIGPPAMARGLVVGFMTILLLTAFLILLVVVANIAGMFLARAAHRRREIAVRLALGAGRGRLVRQLLTESALLCFIGGVVGVLFAGWLVHLIPAMDLPMSARTSLDPRIDGVVFGVSFGLILATGMAVGLTPALQSTRVDLLSALHGRDAGSPRGIGRSRSTFVVVQLAMSLVLLATAGLFERAVDRAGRVDRGLDARNVVVAQLSLTRYGYDENRARAFYAQLLPRLASRPEIAAAAIGEFTPLSISHMGSGITLADGSHLSVMFARVDKGYLETMRIPLVVGRTFNASDEPRSAPVIVINETLARRLSLGNAPLGHLIHLAGDVPREIIGVVRDGKYRDLDEPPTPFAFVPFAQSYSDQMTVHLRVRGDMSAGLAALRTELAALNPNIALENVGALSSQLDLYTLPQRVAAWCIGMFGLLGLCLAAIGIYGVIAYDVAQRTRELGIRLALGARGRDLVAAVLARVLTVTAIAIAIGIPVALVVGRLAGQYLYGVGPADPAIFALVPILLAMVAVLAAYIPAARAARVDPMASLRTD